MSIKNENYSFRKSWHDFYVDEYDGYTSAMTDFHTHDYYEISIIFSGEMRIITGTENRHGEEIFAVISPPRTPHLITCTEGTHYKRINVVFSREYALLLPEGSSLLSDIDTDGRVLSLSEGEAVKISAYLREMNAENDAYRRRLLLALSLSLLKDKINSNKTKSTPDYVTRALLLVSEGYGKCISTEKIAREVGVSRTTLLVGFKRYTGETLGSYIQKCKLLFAISLLKKGETEYEVAERCGFCEVSSLIRAFKRRFGVTPKRYIASLKNSDGE